MFDFRWIDEGANSYLCTKVGRWEYAIRCPSPSPEMTRYYENAAREHLIAMVAHESQEIESLLKELTE